MSHHFRDLDGTLVEHMLWTDNEYLDRRAVPDSLRREIGRLFAWTLFVHCGYNNEACRTAARGYCAVANTDCAVDASFGALVDMLDLSGITSSARSTLIRQLEHSYQSRGAQYQRQAEYAIIVSNRYKRLCRTRAPLALQDFYLLGARIDLVIEGLGAVGYTSDPTGGRGSTKVRTEANSSAPDVPDAYFPC